MSRTTRDQTVEYGCINEDCVDQPTYMVEGRFNAEGRFEPDVDDAAWCPECGEVGEPTDDDVEAA